MKTVVILAIVATIGIMFVAIGSTQAFAEESIEVPFVLEVRETSWIEGDFIMSDKSVFLIVTGDIQGNGNTKINIFGKFKQVAFPTNQERFMFVNQGNIENLIDSELDYVTGEEYVLSATHMDYTTDVSWIPKPFPTVLPELLPSDNIQNLNCETPKINSDLSKVRIEHNYTPKLGTMLSFKVFNEGSETLDGVVSLFLKCDSTPLLERQHSLFSFLYPGPNSFTLNTIDYGYGTGLRANQTYVIAVDAFLVKYPDLGHEVPTTVAIIEFVPQPKTEINSERNKPLTQITSENASIQILKLEPTSEISGKIFYKICAKKDLINPTFIIKSDAKKEDKTEFVELKKGECHEGHHVLLAKSPNTITIPIATVFSTDHEEVESLKEKIIKLETMLEEPIEKTSVKQVDETTVTSSESEGGGCLIATATYGSELAPQVQLLREIRDNSLLNTESGTVFMKTFNEFYYSFSPTIADYERENPVFKEAVKLAITPMISSLALMENANSESEVLGIGISLIALNLAMYIGVPAIIVIGIKKKI